MAEDNQTSMTCEERWAEIQKWVAWVDAQRLLGGELSDGAEKAWASDSRSSYDIIKDWVNDPGTPGWPVLYLLWVHDKVVGSIIQEAFNDLYNKGETQ